MTPCGQAGLPGIAAPAAFPPPARIGERRLAGVVVTLLVHLALAGAWQLARQQPSTGPDGPATDIYWIVPPPAPLSQHPIASAPAERRRPDRDAALPRARPAVTTVPPAAAAPAVAAVDEPAAPPSPPSAAAILDSARRSVGEIDRALRKEARPTIVLPPDSPQIRMRERMELARALAPTRIWEAPKVAELVNNTGDGARRTRVITGNGTYCITERAPTTSIDMIEKHGKQRFTTCPSDEEPAKQQVWRTARD